MRTRMGTRGFPPALPPLSFRDPPLRALAIALLIVAPALIALFTFGLPWSVDWFGIYSELARRTIHPYAITAFFNPPWFAVPLSLLGWMPPRLSQAANAFLNLAITALVVVRYGGTSKSLVLTLTSLPFATLVIYGNVEWIPMSAFLVPHSLGLILIATKPQTGALAGLVWLRQAQSKLRLLLPLIAVLVVSLLVWPSWPQAAFANFAARQPPPLTLPSNASPWPWLIPAGIVLLVAAWRGRDELLGVAATLCLSPYFVLHSATLFMALLAARTPRLALTFSLAMWLSAIVTNWNLLVG